MSSEHLHDPDDPRRSQSKIAAEDITLDALRTDAISPEDVTIRRSTLEAQANRAAKEGYHQLARNFRRAAELTNIPGPKLLEMYDMLRPKRSRYDELLALSQEVIARYDAPETGAYIREAAEAYQRKGLLRE
ncbi:diol dehydratase small subunit [Tabrizicola sp. J26]|uniref:diol dehydratase small subunit n=1 Tax=Alitabrizicola rongguiensis TaxID=2909234 RepID=UPI001F2D1800|nr:diol dehydratase small subunit [Tabrizicola rongguiensis]MCF1711132.1 diol dehydratase small subunit [Tabrizicola rongguiensis]